MSLLLDTAPSPQRLMGRPAFAWRDAGAIALLLALWAAVLIWRFEAVPMQLWDESRNANSALEMAEHGRWLTPTYAGLVDHWNTKPPLLIWSMAALLRLGAPPLVAVRLTSWFAAVASALTLWGVLRYAMKDALAGLAAGVLLLSAALYIGPHAARTGDYDALESAFVLGFALAAWRALEDGRAGWLLVAAGLLSLGVLTKGVAALLALPGLGLYALTRPAQLVRLVRDGRSWAAGALFLAVAGGYYLSRELYDPGYLAVVAGNELGGRFLRVTENHSGAWDYYLRLLLASAEPCTAVAMLGAVTLRGAPGPRRRLVQAAAFAAGSLVVVLSVSSSKMTWYATPVVPLLSLIGGLGLSDALRRVQARRSGWTLAARTAVVLTLVGGVAFGLWWNQSGESWRVANPQPAHLRYGELLRALRQRDAATPVTVVDGGFPNDAGFPAYDPMLKVYAEIARRAGLPVDVVHDAQALSPGQRVASCDAGAIRAIDRRYDLVSRRLDDGCLSGRVVSRRP